MRNLLAAILAMTIIGTAQAQHATILSTIPASEGTLPTMEQLTPGHPDYVYATSLLNARFDEQGVLQYTLPDDIDNAKPQPRRPRGVASADGLWRALNEGDRLYVECDERSIRHEVSEQLAHSDSPYQGQSPIVWGQSVHRNEFGIDGGIFWSLSGHKLAFYRMDQSMVGRYPLTQTDPREAEVKWIYYPMAGMTSHQVTLGIYDPDTQQKVYLKSNTKPEDRWRESSAEELASMNAADHYLTNVSWCPDGRHIIVAEVNRLQNYMEVNLYDTENGDFVKTLFTERSEKYVEPKHRAYFVTGHDDRFVWLSERDGYMQAYLYQLRAEGPAACLQLTFGRYDLTDVVCIDPKGKYLYCTATGQSPLESHLFSVALPNTMKATKSRPQMTQVTTVPGIHRIMMNDQCTQVYDTYTNHETPRVCQLITLKNGKPADSKVLYTAPNPYLACDGHPSLARPAVEVGTLKAADRETDLYYRLVKPSDTTSGKKHPVIVYLYNGPHAQLVTEGFQWGLPGWDCYMALHGYVVFTIDGRGSDNRGLAFEQAIWHNLGYNEGLDQMEGVKYLKSLPYVDAERIGIYGWSYGGFMTTYMKLNYPDTFKVGVCGGPVLDWSRYEVMYGERYMGTPENNPEGYKANTMIDQTQKLKGHLLIIHDDQDGTVVPQMSWQFLKNSVSNGTYPDFMMYMNHEHNVRGRDRVHLLNNITRYFDEHL